MLERYFETKVAVPPYRHNTLKTFITMLNTQSKVLRDFIRILQLEEITSDPNNPQVSRTGTPSTHRSYVRGPKRSTRPLVYCLQSVETPLIQIPVGPSGWAGVGVLRRG